MSNLTLAIYFSGLIAFVPNAVDYPTTMTAYLVNADAGDCAHEQLIWFPPQQDDTCPGSCSYDPISRFCKCPLGHSDIALDPAPLLHNGGLYAESGKPEMRHNPLPRDGDKSDLNDFYYVVRLSNLEQSPVKIKSWPWISQSVGARVMPFGWNMARSCLLDQGGRLDTSQTPFTRHHFTFVNVNHVEGSRRHRQAISKAAKLLLTVPDPSNKYRVTINIAPDHGSIYSPLVTLDCASGCPLIFVTNDLVDPKDPACDGLVEGKHFDVYEQIADEVEGLIPRPLGDQGAFQEKVNACPEFLAWAASAAGRPICPMAIIDPS